MAVTRHSQAWRVVRIRVLGTVIPMIHSLASHWWDPEEAQGMRELADELSTWQENLKVKMRREAGRP